MSTPSNKNVNHFANMLLLITALSAVTEDKKLTNTAKTNVEKEINKQMKKEINQINKQHQPKHDKRVNGGR